MDTRQRNVTSVLDPELQQRVMQTMIGQGLKSHFEVPQQTPEDLSALTARLDEKRGPKR
jgi:hypothetical protein